MPTHELAADHPLRTRLPEGITYPADLPITAWHRELLDAIASHPVVIVAGETGSGKSTQLPKVCLELGRGADRKIGHTQPRRIAARSISERIAEELGPTARDLVGYKVRFTDTVTRTTRIQVMTDGILLNEIQRDPNLWEYDTIIVDEAHERSLNVDFLLGYLKRLLPRRPDLKLIITSATIDTERFAEHFDGAPVLEVAGRTYPVELRYRPLIDPDTGELRDQNRAICDAVVELAAQGTGDILVFCSGEREIRDAMDALSELELRHTEVLPLFGRLSAAQQHRVFAAHTGRRIVVATNVAETSLTVPGIRYVVDTGMARISRYSRRTRVQQLPIEAISQASAQQRSGRCGRLGPGICVRLYGEEDFDSRPEFTEPEILRTNLASVMLQMAAIGLGAVEDFPFIDAPDTRSVKDGIALLEELGAVRPGRVDTDAWLTDVGRKLARIPVDPRLGRILLAAAERGCLDEALTIVSALAIQDPRERPLGKEQAADQRHRRFQDERSDFIGWLRLWDFVSAERQASTSRQFRHMCSREFLNWRRIREWQDVRAQLRRVTRDLGMQANRRPADPDAIHEALLAGLLSHVGKKDPDGHQYRGARGARFAIRPGSVWFKRSPEWVMAAELVETTRTWATGVAAVDPEVVERVGAHVVRRSRSDPWWDPRRGSAVARETVTLFGLSLSTDRTVMYERFDPAAARQLFIRHALVAGEWDTHHAFAQRNAAAVDAILDVERRERRSDLLVSDDVLVAFFDALLPADVTSQRRFDRWWKTERHRRPHLLDLGPDDLIDPDAPAIDERAFPPVWTYGDLALTLSYTFEPSSPVDGVTVDIPLAVLDRIDPAVFEWNVPGLRPDLVTALIRSLPKPLRRQFSPAADTAREMGPHLDPNDGRITRALALQLSTLGGVAVHPEDFDVERVPQHLRPHYRVVESDGAVVARGDDLPALLSDLREAARSLLAASTHPLERDGITSWDFGTLPRAIEVAGSGQPVLAYPALVDMGDSVSIRLLATRGDQIDEMWKGLRRLVILQLPSSRRLVRTVLGKAAPPAAPAPYASVDAWMRDCLECAVDALLAASDPVWDEVGFERLMGTVRDDLAATVEHVVVDATAILSELEAAGAAIAAAPGSVFGDVIDDVEHQIDRFVFDGMLTAVGAERLDDIRRYLAAVTYRLRRLPENPDRDRAHMAIVVALEDEHDALAATLPLSPEMVEVAWMLQELRVSFFAQALGVKGPVSQKRIAAALADLPR